MMYWQWSALCATLLANTTLQDPSIPCIKILQVYGHRVWHAKYSKCRMD